MNSTFSKFEKSVEDCINYNFDDNSSLVKKSKRQLNRPKSKDHQLNGKIDIILTKWLEYKDTYSWLYVYNKNPKCSICEEAIKDCQDITITCWTNPEMSLEINDSKLDEEKILQIHLNCDNHIKADHFLNNKSPNYKTNNSTNHVMEWNLDKESINDVPNFISNLEWNQLKKQFSWLSFKEDLFGCSLCEESCAKQKKTFSLLSILGNSSQKNLRNFGKFEKHEKSVNHLKAIDIFKENSKLDNAISTPVKEESKRVLTVTPRKSLIFSPPNVTTRTAIRKSLCDRNSIPGSIDEKSWNSLKGDHPWLYSSKNILRCSYCEDAFKNHNESMVSTHWTNPESSDNRPVTSLKDLKSKYRLSQHENTKNHETAVKVLSLFKPNVTTKKVSLSVEKENDKEIIEPLVGSVPVDFRIPSTVRASRKSAPVKLTNLSYEDKPHSRDKSTDEVQNFFNSKKQTRIQPVPSIDTSAIPSFLTQEQYISMKTRYSWLYCPDENSYSCSICLEAMKINPDSLVKTRFTSGPDTFEPNVTYITFRKKLYRHSESKNHSTAYNIVNRGSVPDRKFLTENSQLNQEMSSSESRFTRLKSGSKTKIDYKRMSEGFIQNNETEYLYELINVPSEIPKKRKESSVTWICPQCKSHFRNTDDLIQHISLCDYQPSDSTKELACPCNPTMFRFNTITKLDLHAAQEHDNQSYFHCYICSDRYNRLTSLYHHMLIHHLIITWDPFEAYLPVKPIEPLLCIFCSCNFRTNTLLTKHYCYSDCNKRLQPSIVLQDISVNHLEKFHIQEEVTVLDVEELPEEKGVIYSPLKKSRNQHNRISRNHPLRRFGPVKKNNIKESLKKNKDSPKKVEIEDSDFDNKQINQQEIDSIKNKSIDQSDTEPINAEPKIDIDLQIISINDKIDDTKININIDDSKVNENAGDSKITMNIEKSKINEDTIELKSTEDLPIIESGIDLKNNQSNTEIIISKVDECNFELNVDESIVDKNNKSEIGVKQVDEQKDDFKNDLVNQKNDEPKIDLKVNESKIDLKIESNFDLKADDLKVDLNKHLSKNDRKNELKTNKSNIDIKIKTPSNKFQTRKHINKFKSKSPAVQPGIIEMHQVVDLNDIITETESKKLLTEIKKVKSNANHSKSIMDVSKTKKEPIRIQSQLSPCKKLKTIERPDDDDIPSGLSFMDRMKKIRQLKKNRTEQQREQMMAVDRKIAEINEKTQGSSIVDKSDLIKKLLSSEQYSMDDLKSIIQFETKIKPDKRKIINYELNDIISPTTTPKQQKIEIVKSVVSPIKTEIFSCNVCQLKFKSLRARDSHTTTDHKGLKLFCCKVCDLSFTTHILLRKHAQKYHIDNVSLAVFGKENASEINFSFPCSFCPLQFTSRSGLNHHITSGHRTESDNGLVQNDFLLKLIAADPNFSPQSCLICQEIMNNEFELDIHTIEHQKECQTTEVEPTQFACPKCCRLFFGRDGKSYLKDHYNIVHLGKPLPVCEECDTRFASTVCYSMHRKFVKNCSKKTIDQLKIEDPYEKLNDPLKLAFVCSRCQTLIAGQSAESRFEEHKIECNATDTNDDSLVLNSQTECLDGQ